MSDNIIYNSYNNTQNEQFNPNEYGLENMEIDCERGVITIEYQDKAFELVIREK